MTPNIIIKLKVIRQLMAAMFIDPRFVKEPFDIILKREGVSQLLRNVVQEKDTIIRLHSDNYLEIKNDTMFSKQVALSDEIINEMYRQMKELAIIQAEYEFNHGINKDKKDEIVLNAYLTKFNISLEGVENVT